MCSSRYFRAREFEPVAPQPARQGQQVHVTIILVGHGDVMDPVTSGQQRRVEGLAIERHDRPARRKELRQAFEQGRLLGRIAHEVLLEYEFAIHKTCHAHQEGIRAGASREPGRFGIQKGEALQGQVCDARVVGPLGDQGKR